MKKTLLLTISLLVAVIVLSGCGSKKENNLAVGDVANTYGAAQELNNDLNNADKIDSESNVENIYTIMNYQGSEPKEALKDAIRSGLADGKNQGELNKELVLKQEYGTAYMLGYSFGCQAVTKDEKKCNDEMGEKYQVILMEGLNKEFQIPAVEQ